jgi:O6-methylguanine-DNA--protein-cysteine methyltransferase
MNMKSGSKQFILNELLNQAKEFVQERVLFEKRNYSVSTEKLAFSGWSGDEVITKSYSDEELKKELKEGEEMFLNGERLKIDGLSGPLARLDIDASKITTSYDLLDALENCNTSISKKGDYIYRNLTTSFNSRKMWLENNRESAVKIRPDTYISKFWKSLLEAPRGEVVSYDCLAKKIGYKHSHKTVAEGLNEVKNNLVRKFIKLGLEDSNSWFIDGKGYGLKP